MASSLTPSQVGRYLAVLGVRREAPGRDALARLVRAHKLAVPFENTTAILRRHAHPGQPVPPIDPDALLDAWALGVGGGVCFELAEMFHRLLVALGYGAAPLFGRVRALGDHQAVLVELAGHRYLADVGSGMPVLEPVPLSGVMEYRHAGIAVRFRPGETGTEWLQERWMDEAWHTHFRYDLGEPPVGLQEEAYQRHHTPGYNFVVSNIVVVRCAEEAVFQLRGATLTHATEAGSTTYPAADPAEADRLLREVVGLPGLPVGAALAALADRQPTI